MTDYPYEPPYDGGEDNERIAVIGMAGRFPGSPDLDSFWRNLSQGVEGITHFSEDELLAAGISRRELRSSGYVKACPILEDLAAFDAHFFGYTPREAEILDPQQRIFLETCWEALENAGWNGERHNNSTGLYAGASLSHYLMHHLSDSFTYSERGFESLIGNDKDYLAARVAYKLDLGGPALGVQTACSTSLVAIHLASQALLGYEIDMALAGGVTVRLPAKAGYHYQEGGLFSPDGRCRPFDDQARGTMFGSGVGVVVLKRLSDAQAQGDPIRAVILGSAVNNDGARKVGFTAPGEFGQVRALGEALEVAGVEAETIGFIETHGTGTALGDPIEAAALRQVFRDVGPGEHCALGALKSNVGHLECAAGVAGFIKTVLVLEHGQIPPTLHFQKLNEHIDFSAAPFYVNPDLRPWPSSDKPRRAGVSSFGIGGTNAHLVLEEAPQQLRNPTLRDAKEPMLLTVSARSEDSLHNLAGAYDEALNEDPAGICSAAALRRAHHGHRLAVVANSGADLQTALRAYARGEKVPGADWGRHEPGKPRRIVFVYPGQGSQWPHMGRRLLEKESVFREAVKACDQAILTHGGFSVIDMLMGKLDDRFEEVALIQPTLFAVSVGLTRLWQSWGIQPEALIGHSQGEVAAAYIAGSLSLDEAARVICLRSSLVRNLEGKGAMAVAELTESEARDLVHPWADKLAVAAVNSPRGVVLSGEIPALETALAQLEQRGTYARRINVSYASHCAQVEEVNNELAARLSGLQPKGGERPIYSTVLARKTDGAGFDAAYWCDNLRNPVRFSEMVELAAQEGMDTFVEMSPHPVLTHALKDCCNTALVLGSLRRDEPEKPALLESLASLYAHGCTLDFSTLFAQAGDPRRLPTYPWQRQHYWIDQPKNKPGLTLSQIEEHRHHPLLAGFLRSSIHRDTWIWQLEVSTAAVPFLADHAVNEQIIVPAAMYLELAQAAAWQVFGRETGRLSQVEIGRALFLPTDSHVLLQIVLSEEVAGRAEFHISSCSLEDPAWHEHARGGVSSAALEPSELSLERARHACQEGRDVAAFYNRQQEKGFGYGRAFRAIHTLQRGEGQALALLEVPDTLQDATEYRIHPALLDACFQTLLAAAPDTRETWLPVAVEQFDFHAPVEGECWAHARLEEPDSQGRARGHVAVFDQDGRLLLETRGLGFRRVEKEDEEITYQLDWIHDSRTRTELPQMGAHHQPWLVFADRGGLGHALAEALAIKGERVITIQAGDEFHETATGIRLDPHRSDHVHQLMDGRACAGIVYLWGEDLAPLETVDLDAAAVRTCDFPLALAQNLAAMGKNAPPLTVVTVGARAIDGSAGNPVLAPLLALCATLEAEAPALCCRTVDLDPDQPQDHPGQLVQELLVPDEETRIARRGETRLVARLIHYRDSAAAIALDNHPGPWRLHHQGGQLERLRLQAAPAQTVGPGEVQIAVKAAGLNFRDVLVAMGRQADMLEEDAPIGAECAGIVTAVGPDVSAFKAGDEVVALALPAFASSVVVPVCFVCAKPVALSFAEAACMLITPMTAWQALVELARLKEGESVLIHSAAGGTGLAAVRIAKHLGARIYATAGNEEKRAYLRALGVDFVADSRATHFAAEILEATGGRGVDVVLNSLRGEAMLKGLEVLAPFGRFVELGIADIYSNTRVGLWPFHKNLSYYSLELARMIEDRPEEVGRLLHKIMGLLAEGTLGGLPVTSYPFSAAADAFGYMARAVHIGKIALVAEPQPRVYRSGPRIEDTGTYLITGGLGGLGLTCAHHLVEQGARHLLLLGRRAPDDAVGARIEAMRAMGASVEVARADVADRRRLAEVLEGIDPRQALRGILHAAGTIDDAPLEQQNPERFRAVLAPKVAGSWHLHQLTEGLDLDFFVCFSSTAALHGTPGQANYAAANAFMDALAHYRNAKGLTALSINWGGWAEVGLAAEHLSGAARRFAVEPEVGLAALARLLAGAPPVVAVSPVPVPPHLMGRPKLPPLYALLAERKGPARRGDPGLRDRLEAASAEARAAVLEDYLIGQVAAVLRIPVGDIQADAPLNQYGLTSLFALELRNRVEGDLGLPIPVLQFFQNRDLRTFAARVLERLALSAVLEAVEPDDEEEYEELTL